MERDCLVTGASLHFNRGEGFTEGIRLPTESGADASSSRTLWACLQAGVAWVLFDIPSMVLHLSSGERRGLPGPQQQTGTVDRLRRYHITHVLAFPLCAPGGRLEGMLSVELKKTKSWGKALELPGMDTLASLVRLGSLALLLLDSPPQPPGQSAAMQALWGEAARLASGNEALWIAGPPGSGRRYLARWIHEHSPRKDEPFVELSSLNLSPPTLQAALGERGTLHLRGLSDLSHPLQLILVREWDKSAVRVLFSGTGPPAVSLLPELRAQLGGWGLRLPPLSERREEIVSLAAGFLVPGSRLAGDAGDYLRDLDYPGNLHDLRALLQVAGRQAGTIDRQVLQQAYQRLFPPPEQLLGLLQQGARGLLRRQADLAVAEGFSGLLVTELLEEGRSGAEVAELLGLGRQVAAGNHWKSLDKAGDRLEKLCDILQEPAPPGLARLRGRGRR